jgi:acyl dehydratase
MELLLRPGGPPVTAHRALASEWLDELCLWLQRPRNDLGPIGWPMVLVPEFVDARLALPEDALQVFHRVSWRAPVPSGELDLACRLGWVSTSGSRTEIGVATSAQSGGEDVAESLLVVRSGVVLEPWGERALPKRHELRAGRHARSLVVDASQVSTFARLAGTSYPIHDDPAHARRAGYPDVLIQGLLLLLIELHHANPGDGGRIDMWFRQPVPAGSLLDVQTAGTRPVLTEYRLVGSGKVAASAAIFDQPA